MSVPAALCVCQSYTFLGYIFSFCRVVLLIQFRSNFEGFSATGRELLMQPCGVDAQQNWIALWLISSHKKILQNPTNLDLQNFTNNKVFFKFQTKEIQSDNSLRDKLIGYSLYIHSSFPHYIGDYGASKLIFKEWNKQVFQVKLYSNPDSWILGIFVD